MRCPSCRHENRPDARFCEGCGARLARGCAACGAEAGTSARFCGECGAALGSAEPAPSAAAPPDPEAGERRQLTVLFCDLVGSTELSARLDPEDWREAVGAYQSAADAVIARYGGHVAQHLGDGLLTYFGWPTAHGDDAERAVRAARALVDAIAALEGALPGGEKLAVRVGIHTGPVVVSKVGGGAGRSETLALGETPNLAARVQGEARPGSVLVTAATHRLVAGLFAVEALGARMLRGVPEPVELLRVLAASGARSRLAAAAARGLSPFVGREEERRLLRSRFELAREGEGQVVLIVGEPGIGKSRLVQTLREELALRGEPQLWVECAGSPFYANTPFFAVTDMLQQALAFRGDESPAERLAGLERALELAGQKLEESVPLLAPLLGLELPEGRYPALRVSGEQERRMLLGALSGWVFGAARVQPAVMVLEDLHWVDPSTMALQEILVEQAATAALLLVYTARPEFRAPWPLHAHHAQITLARLAKRHVREMAARVASETPLSEELLDTVVARTDGVPLFVEELTKAVVEAGAAAAAHGVPVTLADSLMARLDRLGPAKEVAQVASVIGREFSWRLLREVASHTEEALGAALGRLADAELVYARGLPPDSTYVFKHALVQDTAYSSLLRGRRRELHRRAAEALASGHGGSPPAPEVLAQHWTEAGDAERGVELWRRAGRSAVTRGAYVEAERHLKRGLEVLGALPEGEPCLRAELGLLIPLGQSLLATTSTATGEATRVYGRARVLCEQLGELRRLFPVLLGSFTQAFSRFDLPLAEELCCEIERGAERERSLEIWARLARGYVDSNRCRWNEMQQALAQVLALYDEAHHREDLMDPAVLALSRLAASACTLGRFQEARSRFEDAVAHARHLAKPWGLAESLSEGAIHLALLRDAPAALGFAEEMLRVTDAGVLDSFRGMSYVAQGWALTLLGRIEEGLAAIERATAPTQGSSISYTGMLGALRAEAWAASGAVERAERHIEEVLALFEGRDEGINQLCLLRARAELSVARGDPPEQIEHAFREAIELARRLAAPGLELRPSVGLARLLGQQGRAAEARALLAPLYASFSEGFGERDLVEAKQLLDALA